MTPTELARARVQVADVVRLMNRRLNAQAAKAYADRLIVTASAYHLVIDYVQSIAMDIAADLARERAQTEEGK